MASLIDELIDVLDKEYEIYRGLLPIAEEKTRIIVKNDLVGLQAITDKEQYAVDQITAYEKKREGIMVNVKTVINRKSQVVKLENLIQLLDKQPKEQAKLMELHDNLKRSIHSLMEINQKNNQLIQQSLEMIEFNMNYIHSTRMMPGDNTYTKRAASTQYGGTTLFDTKQ